MTEEFRTIRAALAWAGARLAEAKVDTPRLDAEVLLADALGMDRLRLYLDPDRPLDAAEREAFRQRVARRLAHEPIAYITGAREFYSLRFRVDRRVLIPRPETELLVDLAVERLRDHPAPRVADVGTGSGAIAVALAVHLPRARVVATDIDEGALAVAAQNVRAHGVAERVELRRADLLGAGTAERYHLVVANPPYVAEAEVEALAPEVREFEPRAALVAGTDGLAVIRRLATETGDVFLPGGALLVEFGAGQREAVRAVLAAAGEWREPAFHRDLAGHDRAVLVERNGRWTSW